MATESPSLQQGDSQPVSVMPRAPVGRGKDRRASLVIKETAQLLDGLHQDADRSSALMAELEQLLAASQQASQRMSFSSMPATDSAQVANFSAIQPLQDDASESGEDEDGKKEEQRQALDLPPPPVAIPSQQRRSSVVTFDGSSLFASPSPPSVSTPSHTAQRSTSFNRSRVLPSSTAGKSFTEGHKPTMRRSAVTDVGGGAVVATSVASFVARRPSGHDCCEIPGGVSYMQARRSSAMMYGSVVQTQSQGWRSGGESRTESIDGSFDEPGLVSPPAGLIPSTPAGGGGGSSRSTSTPSNGGRFMRLLKGFFHHPPSASQHSGQQLDSLCGREPSIPQSPGPLSSMIFTPPAQQLRSSASRPSFSNPAPPTPTSRSVGAPLVPTPPAEPQRVLQRSGVSISAATTPFMAPTTLAVRSTSITSNGFYQSSMSSPTGTAGPTLPSGGSAPIPVSAHHNALGYSSSGALHALPPGSAGSVPFVVDCRLGALHSRKGISLSAVPLPQM